MTRIVTNNLLHPTRRVITNWNSDFITSDGPNLSAKISLIDLGIPYDSHYRSRIVLPAGSTDFLLNYGLFDYATFLLVKVTYNGNYDYPMEDNYDPFYYYTPNDYNIEYYYEGDSGKTFPIGRLLVLTGSRLNKIPRICFNNPLGYDVVLDVLHANIAEPLPAPPSSAITISNLYYNNIITNQVICPSNSAMTGSTAFLIFEITPIPPSGYTILPYYIEFNKIVSITKEISKKEIYLVTNNYFITLKFLTDFDCNQSYSRMMFAYNAYLSDECAYLTEDAAYIDGEIKTCSSGSTIAAPVIYYNSGSTWLGSGTTIPINVYLDLIHNGITGWTLDSLKTLFISGITDCMDGNIDLSTITFILTKSGSVSSLTGITEGGLYNIMISVTNNAGVNTTHFINNIIVNDEPPIIYYKEYFISSGLTGYTTWFTGATSAITSGIYVQSGFTFNLAGFDNNIIYKLDIIDNIIDYVYDSVDVDLNKYMVDVIIASSYSYNSGFTLTGITQPGEFLIRFYLKDSGGNEIINYFMMKVLYDVSVYSEGFWQDNKVWVDYVDWLDWPVLPTWARKT